VRARGVFRRQGRKDLVDPRIAGLVDETLRDLEGKTVTGHVDAEGLRTSDVDVVGRQVHAVAGFFRAQWFDGREDRHHSLFVGNALQKVLADEIRLDAFLDDLGHGAGNHELSVLDIQRVLALDETDSGSTLEL
jgi:hypothetical protein